MTFLLLLAGCVMWCVVDQQSPAEPSPGDLPVSLKRIHEQLQRPAALPLPPASDADFRASVTEYYTPPETALDAVRRALGGDVTAKRIVPGTIAPPLVAVDLLQIAALVKRKLGATLRARSERSARRQVEEVLAEFCAVHDCSLLEQELQQSNPEGVLTH